MDVIARAFQLMQDRQDFFLELLGEHLRISFTAICIAMVVGLIIGILVSEFSFISKPTIAVVNLLYTIPSISLLGFLIPFSGIGDTTAIIALTIYALLPMVRNTYTGMTTVSPQLLDAATAMGSTRIQVLLRVRLPLALPVIVAGIRRMTGMTIALSGISSFIGAGGLGVPGHHHQQQGHDPSGQSFDCLAGSGGGLFHRHGGAGGEKAQELIDESADLRGLHCFGNPLDSIDRFFWRFL